MSLSPLETARKLAPMIRTYADDVEEQRMLPKPLFDALADAGLFHLAFPRSMGGGEIDLPTYIQVI
jgi:alkylation response protein AidB-like acyl-CoA dehydrogenase